MSPAARRLIALAGSLSVALALAAPSARAQDAHVLAEPAPTPPRARRGWLPALRLRWIAPVSAEASEPSERGRDEARAVRDSDARAPWLDRGVAPSHVPCATEPGGGADCAGAVTVVLTSF